MHLSIVVVYNLYWSSDKYEKKTINENKNNTGLSKGVHSGINNIQNRDHTLKEDVYHDVWHTVIIISNFQWKWMTEFSSFFCMNNIPLKNTSWYFKNVDVVFHKIMFQLRQKIFLKCIFLGAYSHRSTVFIFCLVILYSLTVAEMQKHNIASLFSKMWLLGITAFFFVLLNDLPASM